MEAYIFRHEGNHEIEETNGLDESKPENGICEELATQGRVARDGVKEGAEDEADTNAGTRQTDSGRAHTDIFRHLNHGLGDLGRVGAFGGLGPEHRHYHLRTLGGLQCARREAYLYHGRLSAEVKRRGGAKTKKKVIMKIKDNWSSRYLVKG